jgi:hypothetical protein
MNCYYNAKKFKSITENMTLEVTPDRVREISLLVEAWLRKKKSSLYELQSLLGKLHFVATCLHPCRLFVSRLLNSRPII